MSERGGERAGDDPDIILNSFDIKFSKEIERTPPKASRLLKKTNTIEKRSKNTNKSKGKRWMPGGRPAPMCRKV